MMSYILLTVGNLFYPNDRDRRCGEGGREQVGESKRHERGVS